MVRRCEKNFKTKIEPTISLLFIFHFKTFSFVFTSKVLTGELFEIPRRLCLFWEVMFLSCYTEPWAEFNFIICGDKTQLLSCLLWEVTLWQVPLCFYYSISYPASTKIYNKQQGVSKKLKFPGWGWCDVGSAW